MVYSNLYLLIVSLIELIIIVYLSFKYIEYIKLEKEFIHEYNKKNKAYNIN